MWLDGRVVQHKLVLQEHIATRENARRTDPSITGDISSVPSFGQLHRTQNILHHLFLDISRKFLVPPVATPQPLRY